MKDALPPLTWFRSFEAAARLLSMTGAAQEIGLTQSAVSQHIKSLEIRLGVALFRRHARSMSLTNEGRKLLPQVEAALQSLQAATAPYRDGGQSNQITVAASISVIEWIIAPRLDDLMRQRPRLQLRFASTIWPDEFSSPRADVEIRFGSPKQVGDGATALKPNQMIAVRAAHLETEFDRCPLIETIGTSDHWQAWFERNRVPRKEPTYSVDAYGTALQLAITGNGIALVSSIIAAQALKSGQVVLAHPASSEPSEGYFLALQRRDADTEFFSAWLLEQVAQA
ncbi:MAG: LysR family transcriptional regulator [Pseudomonadota bacterium]